MSGSVPSVTVTPESHNTRASKRTIPQRSQRHGWSWACGLPPLLSSARCALSRRTQPPRLRCPAVVWLPLGLVNGRHCQEIRGHEERAGGFLSPPSWPRWHLSYLLPEKPGKGRTSSMWPCPLGSGDIPSSACCPCSSVVSCLWQCLGCLSVSYLVSAFLLPVRPIPWIKFPSLNLLIGVCVPPVGPWLIMFPLNNQKFAGVSYSSRIATASSVSYWLFRIYSLLQIHVSNSLLI